GISSQGFPASPNYAGLVQILFQLHTSRFVSAGTGPQTSSIDPWQMIRIGSRAPEILYAAQKRNGRQPIQGLAAVIHLSTCVGITAEYPLQSGQSYQSYQPLPHCPPPGNNIGQRN